jgi:hypothetical protein
LPLGKYSEESNRGFRLDLSVEEADALAGMDQNLIFLDLDMRRLNVEQLIALSVSLGGEPGESFKRLSNKFTREGDDDRAEIFEAMAKRWAELKMKSH